MSGTCELDLAPEHLETVRRILASHVPDREVWAFGSRVAGRARPHSDLDLMVLGEAPLPMAVRAALAEALSESDLPFRVDLVDWATASETLRRAATARHAVVQRHAHAHDMTNDEK